MTMSLSNREEDLLIAVALAQFSVDYERVNMELAEYA